MAISNYTELKAAISEWMDREDVTGKAEDFIALAEAQLNSVLKPNETDATLTGTVGSRSIDISALPFVSPVALFITDPNEQREHELLPRQDGTFPYSEVTGFPSIWAIDGTNIDFNCLLDQAYAFRLRYIARFALSESVQTNSLLTTRPDIYLCACIVWGGFYTADDAAVSRYGNPLNAFISQQRLIEERNRRGRLTVDPALSSIGRTVSYNGRF